MFWSGVTSILLLMSQCISGAREGFEPQGGRMTRNLDYPTNICETIMNSGTPIRCRCDIDDEALAEELECVIVEPMTENNSIWSIFDSQENAEELQITVKPEGFLSFVPKEVLSLLNELKSLELLNTNITIVPSLAFSGHQQLTTIKLNNSVADLEDSAFSKLPELKDIDLSNNILREINRKAFHDLPMLEILDLSRNRITAVHDFAFEKIPSLLRLKLSKNMISVLTPEMFSGLSSLESLDLFDNRVSHLGPETFKFLEELNYLDLSGNMISSIDSLAFSGLNNLQVLRLKDNKIAALPLDLFKTTTMLNYLDLSRNSLTMLPENVFSSLFENFKVNSSVLRFSENPLECNCHMKWLLELKSKTESANIIEHIDRSLCSHEGSILSLNSETLPRFCVETTKTSITTMQTTTRRPAKRRTTTKPQPVAEIPAYIPKDNESGTYEPELDTEPPRAIFSSAANLTTVSEPAEHAEPERQQRNQLDLPSTRGPLPTVKPRHLEHKGKSGASVPFSSGLILPITFLVRYMW